MEKNGTSETKSQIYTKPKKRRLRVSDPDFTPPDGGWGWLIVFACGFSNVSKRKINVICLTHYNLF